MRILGLIVVGAILIAPAAQADPSWPRNPGWRGCPAPVYAAPVFPAPEPGQGERVLVIGDSLTRDALPALERVLTRDGWNPTVRCWGGKRLDWGIDQVRRAKALDQLPDTVVLALGTNDMWRVAPRLTRTRIDQMLQALGPKRTVFWVNLHFDGGLAPSRAKETWFNNELVRQTKRRPNLTVIDWAGTARAAGVRTRDGVHYPVAGSQARAAAIATALADFATTRGVLAPPPRTD
jgi:lysophospholipase L1-like esterase